MATPRLNLTELTEAQSGAHITVNTAIGILDALMGGGAIDNDLLAEPGSPADGDVYILPSAGTLTGTDWATFANDDVAVYYQGWYAITPGTKNEGWTLYVQDENAEWRWSGSAWAVVAAAASTMTDVELPMSQGNPAGLSATPALPKYIGDTDGKHLTLAFADGATNEMNFETILPANYAGGGLTFELGWATTATSLDGYWQIQIERMNVAITASSFAAAQEDIDTSNASASIPNTATITVTDGSQMDSAAAGDWIRVKVTRLGGHASDTLSAVANMLRLVMKETV